MSARYDELMFLLWNECRIFNDTVPVGTPVLCEVDGRKIETVVEQPACVLPSGKAGVMVKGRGDLVALEQVEVKAA